MSIPAPPNLLPAYVNTGTPEAPNFVGLGFAPGGQVDSIVVGPGLVVDDSDPANPVVSIDPDYTFPSLELLLASDGSATPLVGTDGDYLYGKAAG